VRLAISSRSHSANSSCIASPKRFAGVVEGDELDPQLPEVLIPKEPVEPAPEEPVVLLGEHDVYRPALRQLHHAPEAGALRVRPAVPVVHGLLDHHVALAGRISAELPELIRYRVSLHLLFVGDAGVEYGPLGTVAVGARHLLPYVR
jgi:hypothetical protein